VRLISSDAGAAINGETLTSLPPSVLAVMQSDRRAAERPENATIGEWSVPTDRAVTGSKAVAHAAQVTLTVHPAARGGDDHHHPMLKTCRIAGALALGAVTAFVIPAHGSSARFFQAATRPTF
jgi:hypothetical protein